MADVTAPAATPVVLDKALVEALFRKIDANLSAAAFEALYAAAGTTDEARNKSLFNALRKLISGDTSALDDTKIGEIRDKLNAAIDGGITGTILSLPQLSAQDMLSRANTELGARYALFNLLPFALVGTTAVYDRHNQNSALFRYDPNTGEQLVSDAYLKDRADFMAVHLATPGGVSSVPGTQSWVFEDRRQTGADGQPLRITTTATEAERATNRMIFGNDDTAGEVVSGGNGADRLYGMGGDDILRGGAGDDYLEGGTGNDFLQGGRGNDELIGGAGEDELAGDAGNDKLIGGAGVDDLTGGRGDDRMEGGGGFDSYIIETGDGNDVIVDSDGKGEVLLDGAAITGAFTVVDGKYQTTDGKLKFSFAGDPAEGGTLTIEFGEEEARQTIRIHDFRNGQLGITLGDGSEGALLMAPTTFRLDEPPPFDGRIELDPDYLAGQTARRAQPVDAGEYIPAPETGAVAVTNTDTPPGDSSASTPDPAPQPAVSALFADTLANIRYVTGANVSRALADTAPPFFAGAAAATETTAVVTNLVSPADLTHALLDFQSANVLEDGLIADPADTAFDGLLADPSKPDRLGSIDTSIATRISTSLKPADIGLGKVGVK